jgi:SAM-dependent methyltransferase
MMQSTRYEHRRLKLLASHAKGEILDLGHSAFPNPYLPAERTIGLDLEEPRVPSGYLRDEVGSVFELVDRFGPERFDTVVAGELIEHLERPYDFLAQVREVLRDGGQLVLSTPNPLGFPTLFFEIGCNRRYFYTSDHAFYFTPRWVWRMLERTGFQVERTEAVGIWLPFGHVPYSPRWLSYQLVYVATRAHPAMHGS